MENKHRFEEIMEEMNDLLDEAMNLLDNDEKHRARGYWYAHIKSAINKQTEFLGGSMLTMESSLESFEEEVE